MVVPKVPWCGIIPAPRPGASGRLQRLVVHGSPAGAPAAVVYDVNASGALSPEMLASFRADGFLDLGKVLSDQEVRHNRSSG
jgi:hypothetical protein